MIKVRFFQLDWGKNHHHGRKCLGLKIDPPEPICDLLVEIVCPQRGTILLCVELKSGDAEKGLKQVQQTAQQLRNTYPQTLPQGQPYCLVIARSSTPQNTKKSKQEKKKKNGLKTATRTLQPGISVNELLKIFER